MGISTAYVFHSLLCIGANRHVRGRVRKMECHNFPENRKPTHYLLQMQDFLLCCSEILSVVPCVPQVCYFLMRCSLPRLGGNCISGLVVKQDLTSFNEILGDTKHICQWQGVSWLWKRPLGERRLTTVLHQGGTSSFGTSVRNAWTLKAG